MNDAFVGLLQAISGLVAAVGGLVVAILAIYSG